jgi:hypothetical protein
MLMPPSLRVPNPPRELASVVDVKVRKLTAAMNRVAPILLLMFFIFMCAFKRSASVSSTDER